jgi:DNA-binding MarR family transcriptional regulator
MREQDECHGPMTLPAGASGPLNHAVIRVGRLHHQLAKQLLRRTGLFPGQELVMMHLWEHGPQRQVDLIRLLDSDAATMTRTVARLERGGFVRRRPSPTDGRAVIIEATQASQALRGEVEGLWPRLEQLSTDGFTDEERADAIALLGRLEQNLLRAVTEQTGQARAVGA